MGTNHVISPMPTVGLLGIQLDEKLNFNLHISRAVSVNQPQINYML